MKLSEKTNFGKTFITAIPSSSKEDFSLLFNKIKQLRAQPFHCVYLAIPSKYLMSFKKQLNSSDLKINQFQIEKGIARMEIR